MTLSRGRASPVERTVGMLSNARWCLRHHHLDALQQDAIGGEVRDVQLVAQEAPESPGTVGGLGTRNSIDAGICAGAAPRPAPRDETRINFRARLAWYPALSPRGVSVSEGRGVGCSSVTLFTA